jgi:hypothetical protein
VLVGVADEGGIINPKGISSGCSILAKMGLNVEGKWAGKKRAKQKGEILN